MVSEVEYFKINDSKKEIIVGICFKEGFYT